MRKGRTSFWGTLKKCLIVGAGIGVIIMVSIILINRGVPGNIEITQNDIILGNPSAPVTIIEYSDYQCPFCKRFFDTSLPFIKDEFIATGKVRFIYRDFVFYGQESFWAAHAARCANEQGKFWEYHDLLFEQQGEIGSGIFNKENLTAFAQELSLSRADFEVCMDEARYRKQIDASKQEAIKRGVWGTPSFFVNDFGPVFGSHNYRLFKSFIEGAYTTDNGQ
ncbi:MAG: DsbA family protein [bacterium]|nr:DsbA family protein [bacterium]